MRNVFVVAIVMLGCSKPSPPDPKKYAAMSDDEKCKATEPRAAQCADELVVMSLRDLAGSSGIDAEMMRRLETDLEKSGRADDDEAKIIHRSLCASSLTSAYMDAVVACWAVEHCTDFTKCISRAR
jgi:hypothetical protein